MVWALLRQIYVSRMISWSRLHGLSGKIVWWIEMPLGTIVVSADGHINVLDEARISWE